MVTPKTTLWHREPHTAAKHEILSGYLGAWFPIIANGFGNAGVTFVDAFAGPGEYSGGEHGSPLIALRHAARTEVLQSGGPVRLLFIEEKQDRVEHLEDLIEKTHPEGQRPTQWKIRIVRGKCEDVLIPALNELGAEDSPILVNFDGFGVDTPMSLVRHVGRIDAAEVLVTFQTQFFIRFATQYGQTAGDRVFGTGAWRNAARVGSPQEKKTALLDLYRKQLSTAGFPHVITFELIDEGGHELLLFYGTSGLKGLEKMKDIFWRVDPVAGAHFRDPRDVNQLEFDFGRPEPNLELLGQQLLEHLESAGQLSLEQLKEFTLTETVFKPSHATVAVNALEKSGRAECKRAKRHCDFIVRLAPPSLFGNIL